MRSLRTYEIVKSISESAVADAWTLDALAQMSDHVREGLWFAHGQSAVAVCKWTIVVEYTNDEIKSRLLANYLIRLYFRLLVEQEPHISNQIC